MRKRIHMKICAFAVIAALLIGFLPAASETVKADTLSGSTGSTATWEFDESTGILTISGEGEITTGYYKEESSRYTITHYWDELDIKTVIIEDGITSIGMSTFENLTSITSITIPDSVTEISWGGFFRLFLSGKHFIAGVNIRNTRLPVL